MRTRESILDPARLLFLDQGYAGARIGDITARCGISRAGFYTCFRGMREVFDARGPSAFRKVRRCTTTTWCTR
jgi:AcrR family transcriptional regulator